MPDPIVASDPLDLLSYVPELVGFEPRRSLVLVALRDRLTCGTLRVDLPCSGPPGSGPPGSGASGSGARGSGPNGSVPNGSASTGDDAVARGSTVRKGRRPDAKALAEYVSSVVGMVCRIPGANGVIPIVFTDEACATGAPGAELFTRLRAASRAAGFLVRDQLFVAADGWGRVGSRPRARAELDSAWRLRRLDPDAAYVGLSPSEEAVLPQVPAQLVERTAAALAALGSAQRTPDPVWFAEYSARWRPNDIGPASAALTAAVLEQPWARDVVLFTWAWGSSAGTRALRFQERHLRGDPPVDEDIALALAGRGSIGRPHPHAVTHAIDLLRQVAARLPAEKRGPCLASLAWLNWALGRGSVAGEYARAALAVGPDYGFAQLIHTVVERGMLPEWAFVDRDQARQRAGPRRGTRGGMRR
jgi:hypothetical protein